MNEKLRKNLADLESKISSEPSEWKKSEDSNTVMDRIHMWKNDAEGLGEFKILPVAARCKKMILTGLIFTALGSAVAYFLGVTGIIIGAPIILCSTILTGYQLMRHAHAQRLQDHYFISDVSLGLDQTGMSKGRCAVLRHVYDVTQAELGGKKNILERNQKRDAVVCFATDWIEGKPEMIKNSDKAYSNLMEILLSSD